MTTVGFIGLGKLGLACAEEIAKSNHYVKGFDISGRHSDYVKVFDSIEECVQDCSFVFVAVPTPHDKDYDGSFPSMHLEPKDFDYSTVESVLKEANQHMNENQILVLISTVLPGTTRERFINLLTNTRFIYNPYLIAMGSVAWDMVNPEMVIVGTEDGTETGDANALIEFYKTIMKNNPRYVVGTWDEAECIKIFYNTFISTKIGLVNMIQDVAEKQGNINVDVVTTALANSTMRIMGPQYMTAGMGDGGACHPRDNIALRFLAQKLDLGYDIFDAIMGAREQQAKLLAKKLVDLAASNQLPIVIHGKAYKPGVGYINGSYSLLIGHYCSSLGITPEFVDPLTDDERTSDGPAVFLLAHNSAITYRYANISKSTALYCDVPDGSIVVDPWRLFQTEKDITVIHYGNTR